METSEFDGKPVRYVCSFRICYPQHPFFWLVGNDSWLCSTPNEGTEWSFRFLHCLQTGAVFAFLVSRGGSYSEPSTDALMTISDGANVVFDGNKALEV